MKNILPVAFLAITPGLTSAQDPYFQGVGDVPGGVFFSSATAISPDGQNVVGISQGANGVEAFLWNAAGILGLGDLPGGAFYSQALGVTTYGLVVGVASDPQGEVAFSWRAPFGMIAEASYHPSRMTDVSEWAGFGVGTALLWGVDRAMWFDTSSPAVFPIGDPHSEPDRAQACSAFYNLAVGEADLATGTRACQWLGDPSRAPLVREILADGGADSSGAINCSTDGRLVVGYSDVSGARTATGWFHGSPFQILDPSGIVHAQEARAVSGRGERIVGKGTVPWIFQMAVPNGGPRELVDLMQEDYGLDLTGWVLIDVADISGDGQYVTGTGINPQGMVEAWVAFLPIGCRADLNGDGDVNLLDVTMFSDGYHADPPTAEGDYNGDGTVNLLDVTAFSSDYIMGCPHQGGGQSGGGGGGGGGLWPHVPAGDPDDVGGGET